MDSIYTHLHINVIADAHIRKPYIKLHIYGSYILYMHASIYMYIHKICTYINSYNFLICMSFIYAHMYGSLHIWKMASIYVEYIYMEIYIKVCIYIRWIMYMHIDMESFFCICMIPYICTYIEAKNIHKSSSVYSLFHMCVCVCIYKIFTYMKAIFVICETFLYACFHIYMHTERLCIYGDYLPYMHTSIYMCI